MSDGWAGPLLGFDTETTGTRAASDRLVQAALVEQRGHRQHVRTWLADPGIEIPEAAQHVHGISTEQARREGRDRAQVIAEVVGYLEKAARAGVPIVIYNARFDLTLIEAEARRVGVTPLTERLGALPFIIDPLVLDRSLDRWRKGNRQLGTLADFYDVRVDEALHDAAADVRQTLAVWDAMCRAHPTLTEQSPTQLMEMQADAHRQWAQSFGDWLRKKGRTPDIGESWPLEDDWENARTSE